MRIIPKRSAAGFGGFVGALTLAMTGLACDAPPPPPKAPVAPPAPPKVEAPKVDPAVKAADVVTPFSYSYNPVGKRDPFHSPIDDLIASAAGGVSTTTNSCNQPLCKWDLDQLKLVGIVSGMANPVAMVEDPQGTGHFVRRNSFVGKRGGRVTQIKRDEIVVTEIFKGPDGKPHPNNIDLKISSVSAETIESADLLEGEASE